MKKIKFISNDEYWDLPEKIRKLYTGYYSAGKKIKECKKGKTVAIHNYDPLKFYSEPFDSLDYLRSIWKGEIGQVFEYPLDNDKDFKTEVRTVVKVGKKTITIK